MRNKFSMTGRKGKPLTTESTFIALMRNMATAPGARGLLDDAAIITLGSETLILTHDMMAEDVHWMASADAADVAWKLVSVNLSDLAAKGARPSGLCQIPATRHT